MEYLYVEKTELIYTNISNPNPPTINISYDSISTVFYGIYTRKMLFGIIKKPEMHIAILASQGRFMITEHEVGQEKLDEYIEQLKDFCHRHHVTIRETTGDTKEDWRY